MVTMTILAIGGAFLFGFALCSVFAVGAVADRSDHRMRGDGYDVVEAVMQAVPARRTGRHGEHSGRGRGASEGGLPRLGAVELPKPVSESSRSVDNRALPGARDVITSGLTGVVTRECGKK